MKATIYCRTVEKGVQAFYVKVKGERYFLFRQNFRRSVKEFFANGVMLDKIGAYDGVHSFAVRRTLDKLPAYLQYIEKEYGIGIYDRTKDKIAKRSRAYKREKFNWNTIDWDVA